MESRNVLASGKRRLRPIRPCTTTSTAEESPPDPPIGEALASKPVQDLTLNHVPQQTDDPIDSDWLLLPGSLQPDFSLNELPLFSSKYDNLGSENSYYR